MHLKKIAQSMVKRNAMYIVSAGNDLIKQFKGMNEYKKNPAYYIPNRTEITNIKKILLTTCLTGQRLLLNSCV